MESRKKRGIKIGTLQVPSRSLPTPPPPPPPTATQSYLKIPINNLKSSSMVSTLDASEMQELQRLLHAPPSWNNNRQRLSKTLSLCDTARDVAWEKRRRQILRRERRRKSLDFERDLTDADLHELKGSIELGFGFNEEGGQKLCNTLPALDLYFAVNRQVSPVTSPRPATPQSQSSDGSYGGASSLSTSDSPRSEESWKICYPGDSPERVKTKLPHWAQAVACSVMQAS